jgi:hypothetical protein
VHRPIHLHSEPKAKVPHQPLRFLNYLRADGVFLPSTVPDPPVHGDVEGEELNWEESCAQTCAEFSMDNLKFDLTEVQNAIGHVSDPSVTVFFITPGYLHRTGATCFSSHHCQFQALQELSPSGHGVFLKTNWSAPKDASFLIGREHG